jgi:hypothetical protein
MRCVRDNNGDRNTLQTFPFSNTIKVIEPELSKVSRSQWSRQDVWVDAGLYGNDSDSGVAGCGIL